MTRECKECGKVYNSVYKYCSLECKIKRESKVKDSGLKKKKPCIVCETMTTGKNFCSIKCRQLYKSNPSIGNQEDKKRYCCNSCGKETIFIYFCSNDCRKSYKKESKKKSIIGVDNRQKFLLTDIEIRSDARLRFSKLKITYCENCSYSKNYQIAHIKAVSSFLDNDFIKDINDLTNLIALCPNCHWEFDHNLMNERERNKIIEKASFHSNP